MSFQAVRLFIRLSRPLFLVGAALLYALGAGMAHYLGFSIDWNIYFIGQAWVTTLQLATHYLNEYFDAPTDVHNPNRTPLTGGSGVLDVIDEQGLPREVALWAAAAALTLTSISTLILISSGGLPLATFVVMAFITLGAVFYSVPPVTLMATGYGELTTSIVVAALVPALAFFAASGSNAPLGRHERVPFGQLAYCHDVGFRVSGLCHRFEIRKADLIGACWLAPWNALA